MRPPCYSGHAHSIFPTRSGNIEANVSKQFVRKLWLKGRKYHGTVSEVNVGVNAGRDAAQVFYPWFQRPSAVSQDKGTSCTCATLHNVPTRILERLAPAAPPVLTRLSSVFSDSL